MEWLPPAPRSFERSVAVIGTLDTKNDEIAYIADALNARGLGAVVIDCGILGRGELVPAVTREQVADAAGMTLEDVRQAGSRGAAVTHMQRGLRRIVPELATRGSIHGAICLGGAEGGLMGAAAMHDVPIGFPKLIVSPSASGPREFGPFMGSTDMLVMHSVVDIMGLNNLARSIFDNAVAAIAGMVTTAGRPPAASTSSIGITMLGQTTPGASSLARALDDAGLETVTFHANGVGGPALDALAAQGGLAGVVDFTLSELANSVMGGLHATGPLRGRAAIDAGLPVLIVPGATDFFNCGAAPSVPAQYLDRKKYPHNPVATLVRLNTEEMRTVGHLIADLANAAPGRVRVMIPARGFSLVGVEGGALHDPEADAALIDAVHSHVTDVSCVDVVDRAINDAEFGKLVADRFLAMRAESINGIPEPTTTRAE